MKPLFRLTLIAVAAVALPACGAQAGQVVVAAETQAETQTAETQPLTVRLDSGPVRGVNQGKTRMFSGIRFAQPPVGDLRWKDPVPVKPWQDVADATKPGERCAQLQGDKMVGSEDCLFVNVTTPKKRPAKALPVMVWFHGGGYIQGAGSDYDAQRMADRGDVMVVTVNYRLGVFGYFGLPGLAGSGSFGMADQLAALRWTKRNAAAFGGDARNVTLFGESAGGMSTCALLTSPAARGLFEKAAIQSGTCTLEWLGGMLLPIPGMPTITPYSSLKQNQATGQAESKKVGCAPGKELECMRAKTPAELKDVTNTFASNLAYDTPLLPVNPVQALREGKFHRVPVMSGGTRDEARGYIWGGGQAGFPVTAKNYPELMRGAFGDQADKVLAKYPLSDYRSPALAWATVSTDRAWSCPTLKTDRMLAAHTPVYAFEFADRNAPNINSIAADFPPGAAHATELPYLFDLAGIPSKDLLNAGQLKLADQMIDYWTAFARTGDPNADGGPRWSRFTKSSETVLSLKPGKNGIGPADYSADHRCGLWDSISK
jgi:para-nitrobenzyl esterase